MKPCHPHAFRYLLAILTLFGCVSSQGPMITHIDHRLALGPPVPVVLTIHLLHDVCARALIVSWGDSPLAKEWKSTACLDSLLEVRYTYHLPGHYVIRVIAINAQGQEIDRDEIDIRIGQAYL